MTLYILTILLIVSSVCSKELKKVNKYGEGPDDPSKVRNVVVYGIPEKENENILETVDEFGREKLGMIKPLKYVDRAYRIKCPEPMRPIVIKLRDTVLKHKFLNLFYKRRQYLPEIYMGEDELHKTIRKLEEKTHKWAMDKDYAVWNCMKQVYYKKTNDSPVYRVEDIEHLRKIKENEVRFEVTDRIQTKFYSNASQCYPLKFYKYTGPRPREGKKRRG